MNKNIIFNTLRFDYTSFDKAYSEGISRCLPAITSPIQLMKLKDIKFTFEPINFLNKLEDYITSKPKDTEQINFTRYWWYNPEYIQKDIITRKQGRTEYGFNTYVSVESYLQSMLNSKNTKLIDYRIFHLMYEHKKSIRDRTEYILSTFKLTTKLTDLLQEYEEVVRAFHIIRFQIFKYNISYDKMLLGNILELIDSIRKKELDILKRIHQQIRLDLQIFR